MTRKRIRTKAPKKTSAKPRLSPPKGSDILSEKELEHMKRFTKPNGKKLCKHIIAVNEFMLNNCFKDGAIHQDYVSIGELVKDNKWWNLLMLHWKMYDKAGRFVKIRNGLEKSGLPGLRKWFKEHFNIELDKFDPQLEHTFKQRDSFNQFFRRIMEWILRSEQNRCIHADCDAEIGDRLLHGGICCNESDHVLENLFHTDEDIKKKFTLTADNLSKPFAIWLAEWPKTAGTCHFHHQRLGHNDLLFQQLPSECDGKYALVDESGQVVKDVLPLSHTQVQSSSDGKALQNLTDTFLAMTKKDIEDVSWDSLKDEYETKFPFRFRDVVLKDETKWEISDAPERKYTIKSLEHQIEKRLCRGCFRCGKSTLDVPAKRMPFFHGHHVDEDNKDFNPSRGPCKEITESRSENCKTVNLCAPCHVEITCDSEENGKFLQQLKIMGYEVENDGKVVCNKQQDSFKVVNTNVL